MRRSHIPATACPGTPQTNSYVPARVAAKEKVARAPRGRPASREGVAAPGKAGRLALSGCDAAYGTTPEYPLKLKPPAALVCPATSVSS